MRVLVIEKDPALARLYREELEDAGFGVRVIPGLSQAMALLRASPFDVLVTDESSCGMGYMGWLPEVRRIHHGPVVMLGARRKAKCREQGIALMPKTSDLAPLIESLRDRALWPGWNHTINGNA